MVISKLKHKNQIPLAVVKQLISMHLLFSAFRDDPFVENWKYARKVKIFDPGHKQTSSRWKVG